MPLNQGLREILACPKCKQKLKYDEREDRLLCDGCRLSYEVRDGIPVMLIGEARSF